MAIMLTAAAAIRFTIHPSAFFFFSSKPSCRFNNPFLRNINSNNILSSSISAAAKKRDDDSAQQQTQFSLKFSGPSSTLLVQSAITMFGLGFVDAGYSGDWSRIGVISKDIEEMLKVSAFLVVPLCFFLLYTLSAKQKEKSSD